MSRDLERWPRKRLLRLVGSTALAVGLAWSAGACDESGTSNAEGIEVPPQTNALGVECGCGEAACGVDACGNSCGTCEGAGSMCWDGTCQQQADLGCDLVGFDPASEAAYTALSGGQFRLTFVASTDTDNNEELTDAYNEILQKVKISLRQEDFFGDDPHFGTFELGEENFGAQNHGEGCDLCLAAYDLCNDQGCAPSSTFLPDSGTITIASDGAPGESFTATLKDVRLTQYWDKSAGPVSPLPNAKTWCIDHYAIDVPVPGQAEASGNCVPDGTGKQIGHNIKDFTLQNCLGDDINLHSVCGVSKAVYIVASAEW